MSSNYFKWTTSVLCLFTALCISAIAQNAANNYKLDHDFLNAVAKGDVSKMNALAQKGADVKQYDSISFTVEDIQAIAGGCRFRMVPVHLTGASITMFTAIESSRLEAVRALLGLGVEVKTAFPLSSLTGWPINPTMIYSASMAGQRMSLTLGGVSYRADSGGFVVSSNCPTVNQGTYVKFAQVTLAALRDAKKRQESQQIVDVLIQALNQ